MTDLLENFTKKQIVVLEMYDLSRRKIAEKFGVTSAAIKDLEFRMKRKLGLAHRSELRPFGEMLRRFKDEIRSKTDH